MPKKTTPESPEEAPSFEAASAIAQRLIPNIDPRVSQDVEREHHRRLLHRCSSRIPPGNAEAFLGVQKEFGTFDKYIWQFVGGLAKQNAWTSPKEVPARTPESDAMSKDLKRRGFKFVGSTICYAFMQAVGMVNDHLVSCDFRDLPEHDDRGSRTSPRAR